MTHKSLTEVYPTSDYKYVQKHLNGVVLWRKEPPGTEITSKVISERTYMFFVLDNLTNEYSLTCQSSVYNDGLAIAKPVWKAALEKHPPFDGFAHIENLLMDMVNKNKAIEQFDFSVVIHDGTKWRCFFPSIESLEAYHLAKHQQEPNQKYLDFLASEQCKEIRKTAEETGMVKMPC